METTTRHREQWSPGDRARFDYHCWESDESVDAPAWHRTGQVVTVLSERDSDGGWGTFAERAAEGTPKAYRVLFADGLEWDVTEDELTVSV